MKHFLVTLWNVDLFDIGWLRRRQKIFERFTLPSVEAQKNKDFEWILVSDTRTPDKFQSVLNKYPARTVYHDWENYKWTATGNDFGDKMKLAIRLETVGDVIAEYIGEQNTDYVITSRLDNDDMLANGYIDYIQRFAQKEWDAREADKFWLSLVRGFRWCGGRMYPFNSIANSFLSFVEDPKNLKTCYTCVHTLAKSGEYPIKGIRQGEPQWSEVIHGENVMNRLKRHRGQIDAEEERHRFNWGKNK